MTRRQSHIAGGITPQSTPVEIASLGGESTCYVVDAASRYYFDGSRLWSDATGDDGADGMGCIRDAYLDGDVQLGQYLVVRQPCLRLSIVQHLQTWRTRHPDYSSLLEWSSLRRVHCHR